MSLRAASSSLRASSERAARPRRAGAGGGGLGVDEAVQRREGFAARERKPRALERAIAEIEPHRPRLGDLLDLVEVARRAVPLANGAAESGAGEQAARDDTRFGRRRAGLRPPRRAGGRGARIGAADPAEGSARRLCNARARWARPRVRVSSAISRTRFSAALPTPRSALPGRAPRRARPRDSSRSQYRYPRRRIAARDIRAAVPLPPLGVGEEDRGLFHFAGGVERVGVGRAIAHHLKFVTGSDPQARRAFPPW